MLLLSLLGTVNTNGTGSLFQKRLRFKLFNQDDPYSITNSWCIYE